MSQRVHVSAADFVRNVGYWQNQALRTPILITYHGRERLVLASAATLADEDSEVSKISSERRSLAGKYAALRDNIWSGVVIQDEDLIINETNRSIGGLLDCASEEMLGRTLAEFLSAAGGAVVSNCLRRVLRTRETESFSGDAAFFGGRVLSFRFVPVPWGVAALVRDTAEETRAREEERAFVALRGALAFAPNIAGVRLDPRCRIVAADQAILGLLEFSPDELRGLRMTDLVALSERRAFSEALERVLHENESLKFAARLMCKRGDDCAATIGMAPILDTDKAVGVYLVLSVHAAREPSGASARAALL